MVLLLYGSGLRLNECLNLRVKDIDFHYKQIIVRNGKGFKDRFTILPDYIKEPLQLHLKKMKSIHDIDVSEGFGSVYLPEALARKYPNADREWKWQYIFPASRISIDPRSGIKRRHHLDSSVIGKAVRTASRACRLTKHITCHTFRHSFATHLLEN